MVWAHWKRLGGDLHYKPPMLATPEGMPHVMVAPVADPGDMAVPGAMAVDASSAESVIASAESEETRP